MNKTMDIFLSRSRNETATDQWMSQILLRILMKAKVIYVSSLDPEIVEKMHMIPASTLSEAINLAKKILVKDNATITAITDGVSVVVI